jgi:hypothetical protein
MNRIAANSKLLAVIGTLLLALAGSFELRSRSAAARPGPDAPAQRADTPQAEPPSNEIPDFQQLD